MAKLACNLYLSLSIIFSDVISFAYINIKINKNRLKVYKEMRNFIEENKLKCCGIKEATGPLHCVLKANLKCGF